MASRRDFFERVLCAVLPAGLLERAADAPAGGLHGSARAADGAAGQASHGSVRAQPSADGNINVRDHGAVGDGSIDDTAGIQRAAAAGDNLLFPPGRYRVGRDLALTARLVLRKGAVLAAERGATLTIRGAIDAGLYPIFAGRVAFGPGTVGSVYPQWWGAKGDGVHDDTAALQAAFNVRTVTLPAGKYRTTRPLEAKNGLRVEGVGNLWSPQGARDSWICYDGPADHGAAVLHASQAPVGEEPGSALSNVVVRGVVLDGSRKAGYGLYAAYCTNDSVFTDIAVIRTTRHGLWANKLWYARFEHITARDNLGCGITIGQRARGWSRSAIPNGIYVVNLRAHSNGGDQAYDERSNPEWGYGIGFFPGNAVVLRNAVSEMNFGPGIVFGLGGGTANAIDGFYLEGNGVDARNAGQATRNWGLVVAGQSNARGNEVARGRFGGSAGRADAQALWLTGEQPAGTLVLKDLAFGQHLRADWSNYRLEGAIYWGLRNYIQGHQPRAATDGTNGG